MECAELNCLRKHEKCQKQPSASFNKSSTELWKTQFFPLSIVE